MENAEKKRVHVLESYREIPHISISWYGCEGMQEDTWNMALERQD